MYRRGRGEAISFHLSFVGCGSVVFPCCFFCFFSEGEGRGGVHVLLLPPSSFLRMPMPMHRAAPGDLEERRIRRWIAGAGRAWMECRENKENNVRTSVLEACTLLLCLSDFSGCAARGSTLLIPRSFRAHSSTQ